MPPSPSPRRSLAREPRVEDSHKRGHSFEGRIPLKVKDDDLALFSEMQNHERDNFLLHASDDFDESIYNKYLLSILDFFPLFCCFCILVNTHSTDLSAVSFPRISTIEMFFGFQDWGHCTGRMRVQRSLNADGEKNDYDWLLTPPDTPLFPSLDDDEPQPANVYRGRTRTQPISISRTSMIPRTKRSSASPSPRSGYSVSYSRITPSSAYRPSLPPVLRSTTPSRRSSAPLMKPSSLAQRSLTPILWRMSTSSSGQAFTGRRGTSPVDTNRGSSASPKLHGWQSNLPVSPQMYHQTCKLF
ncbi:unnamed protein product [Musa textilis]